MFVVVILYCFVHVLFTVYKFVLNLFFNIMIPVIVSVFMWLAPCVAITEDRHQDSFTLQIEEVPPKPKLHSRAAKEPEEHVALAPVVHSRASTEFHVDHQGVHKSSVLQSSKEVKILPDSVTQYLSQGDHEFRKQKITNMITALQGIVRSNTEDGSSSAFTQLETIQSQVSADREMDKFGLLAHAKQLFVQDITRDQLSRKEVDVVNYNQFINEILPGGEATILETFAEEAADGYDSLGNQLTRMQEAVNEF